MRAACIERETAGWVKSIHATRSGELLGLVMIWPHVTDIVEACVVAIEIRVRGHLGQTTRVAFTELRASIDGADTVLTGPLSDQAAVFGVLAAIESLGLELLEVRRIASD